MERDSATILEGLRQYLSGTANPTGLRPLSMGHSSETYIVEGADLVLRMPPTEAPLFGPYYSGVDSQHAVLEELGARAQAPPVPGVHGLCLDESVLGAPFMLMERVDGEAFERELPAWLTEPEDSFRSSISEQWVDALGQIHCEEPLVSLGPSLSTEEEIGRWRHLTELAGARELVALFDQLLAAGLPSSGPPALVHGDCKMANFMWRDGGLVAVLDWEVAFNGDPMNDLGYALSFVPDESSEGYPGYGLPGMWTRGQIIEGWEQRTGRQAEGIDLYVAAGIAKVASIVAYGISLYDTGKSPDERFARWKPAMPMYLERIEKILSAKDRPV